MIKQQEDDNYSVIDKICLIQMKQNINILLKHFKTMISNDWKIHLIEYSNNMQYVYKNIEE